MIIEKSRAFNSKVLLFGEYSLIHGSMALSIPYNRFKGQLLFDSTCIDQKSTHYSVVYLVEYFDFLKNNDLSKHIKIEEFYNDIHNGLYFDCNIPISYGLGSSGSIIASIFSAYSNVDRINDLDYLKSIFSNLESYYHGKSSGLDPLVSYLNKPLLISENNSVEIVDIQNEKILPSQGVFLIDTKTTGETQPLVSSYLNKYKNEDFRNKIQNTLIPLNKISIENLLNGLLFSDLESIKKISEFTLDHFSEMIPDSIINFWKKGLESDDYYLKLCGSGGGGMMLGFSNNLKKAMQDLNNEKLYILFS